MALGVFGTALLYGDGIITPAISVLSAVEGLGEVSASFDSWVIPIAIAILFGLFLVQSRGTKAVGRVFGPVMVLWFGTLALLGLSKIIPDPGIIASVNPIYAIRYFTHESGKAFLSLGSIFLVVTGGEALYADMGHFGRRPITMGWYAVVLPALVLNYWGQGAFLLAHPEAIESVFFGWLQSLCCCHLLCSQHVPPSSRRRLSFLVFSHSQRRQFSLTICLASRFVTRHKITLGRSMFRSSTGPLWSRALA